jgi:hypothetical protein
MIREDKMEFKTDEDKKILQVLGIISSINPAFNQLAYISNGSKSMMSQSSALIHIYKKMSDLSFEYQGILSKAETTIEIDRFRQYYHNEMIRFYLILIPEVNNFRKNSFSKGLPKSILGPIIVCIQEIENGIENIMEIVDKENERKSQYQQTLSPKVSKAANDEQELRVIYDITDKTK